MAICQNKEMQFCSKYLNQTSLHQKPRKNGIVEALDETEMIDTDLYPWKFILTRPLIIY